MLQFQPDAEHFPKRFNYLAVVGWSYRRILQNKRSNLVCIPRREHESHDGSQRMPGQHCRLLELTEELDVVVDEILQPIGVGDPSRPAIPSEIQRIDMPPRGQTWKEGEIFLPTPRTSM